MRSFSLDFSGVHSLLEQWTSDGTLPGAAVLALWKGERVLELAAGQARLDPMSSASTEHIWAAASISKPIAALAVMQQVEAGAFSLDQPLSQILPEFGPDREQITIRHILTHTSGLADQWPHPELFRREGLAGALAKVPVLFPPGTACAYSTPAYTLVDALIHRVTGKEFTTYARQHIFEPLGMQDSSFHPPAAWSGRIPAVYDMENRLSYWWSNPWRRVTGGPGGGLYSTIRDLGIFGQAILDDDRRLLTADGFRQMTEWQTRTQKDLTGHPQAWGLGWYLYRDERQWNGFAGLLSRYAYGHGGATGTWLGIDPQQELVIVLLANRLGLELSRSCAIQEQLVHAIVQTLP